uniref:Uncharacterized protein n=1 Tax=Parascaris univalens TaxID=6257 RepID=A0A915BRB2_PARUN
MGELETKGQEDDKLSSEFAASGRTGRRNAVPDVDVQGIDPDAIKLAERISHINTSEEEIHQSTSSTSDNATNTLREKAVENINICQQTGKVSTNLLGTSGTNIGSINDGRIQP